MKWQPIETAPRDGTLILLYVPGSRLMEIVIGRRDGIDDEDWMMDCGDSAFPIDMPVTHWMPLPEHPTN